MSDQDWIVIRGTDTPLDGQWCTGTPVDGQWYDRNTMEKLEAICPIWLERAGRFIMAPTGEFEEREDGERAEVWVPRKRLLAYLLSRLPGVRLPTKTSTEPEVAIKDSGQRKFPSEVYWTDEMLEDAVCLLPKEEEG